ncbi:HupE/UreJ family protein [Alteraurantiacibacter aquimixticola]|uniref:HupE/UreJ family protein n=1 Tax=Alteraurantiacibacter aquimixticola TaxID=2489173 RepID=UPI00145A2BFC|nr:HupE/UreJ family protein [Alteraurantiacibacter aquimixticola]
MASLLLAIVVALGAVPAQAHDARPASVLIRELPNDRFAMRVRAPGSVALDNRPIPVAPGGCTPVNLGAEDIGDVLSQAVVSCPGGVQGKRFGIAYPIYNPSLSTLFRLEQLDAPPLSALLPPSETSWTIPERASVLEVVGDYFRLGVQHILGGLDHLLFVTGLLLVAGTFRRSLIALTGFTLAHSITLALSTLNLVRLPAPPVEAVIALSILFLAVEIVRGRKDSLTFRYPALVATLFGLLHGFGFAGVLREIGIPQTEIAAALLAFNVGVEAGQVAFVLLALALYALVRRAMSGLDLAGQRDPGPAIRQLCAYGMGMVAVFWLVQRMESFA